MAELIDISNEKFWDILFDEVCVEGQQAERMEKALKTISTTEAEIMAKAEHTYENCHNITCRRKCQKDGYNMAISDFLKALEEHTQKNWIDYHDYGITFADLELVAEQLKEE